MIIYFQSTIEELVKTKCSDLEDLINRLMDAAIKGYHHIIIEHTTAKWVYEHVNMLEKQKTKLQFLIQHKATRSSIIKVAPIYLTIHLGNMGLTEASAGKYHIGHLALFGTQLLEKPHFTVENSVSDGDLFSLIFDAMNKLHPVRVVTYEIEMGGGSSLSEVFSKKLKNQRVTVALADGDKLFPLSEDSDLLKKLRRHASKQVYIGATKSLPCRDAENLIPIEFVHSEGLCPTYPKKYLNHLINIQKKNTNDITLLCPLLYFDMKEGISVKKLNAKPAPIREWIHTNFCMHPKTIIDENIPGFGENILSKFTNDKSIIKAFNRYIREQKWPKLFLSFFAELRWYFAGENLHSTA